MAYVFLLAVIVLVSIGFNVYQWMNYRSLNNKFRDLQDYTSREVK